MCGSEGTSVGCCGFPCARAEYFRTFALVEVQQTFYRLPRLSTASRWRAEAPAGFTFAMKASQLITHPASSPTYRRSGLVVTEVTADRYGFFRPTDEVGEAWARTASIARALACRVVLFQCPASFRQTEENIRNLRHFFEGIRRDATLVAWEPRGDWSDDAVRGICGELQLLHCTDPMVRTPRWGEPWYLRLHGGPGYRHSFTREELERLAALVEGRAVMVLFNNVSMLEDARTFARLIGAGPG
jgi:uncharacterized protein YecE (DUF72 family)